MNKDSKIYITGHRGLAGSAIVRELQKQGYTNLLLKTSNEVNLLDAVATDKLFVDEKPEYVFMCAGTVGGIIANKTYPVEFTQNNTLMAINILSSAHKHHVKKLVYLGSSCIYPKESMQPIKEEYLLTGSLEPTNEGYALAKIMGIKLCEYYRREYNKDFISVMPSNLYGTNDNYDPENSHVIAGLLYRFHEAKEQNLSEVIAWGTGTPKREFIYTDDFARGTIFAMKNYSDNIHLNIGSGQETSIKELTELVAETIGFTGKIIFDSSKPDGTMRKIMDNTRILAMGWKSETSLKEGLKLAYQDYLLALKENKVHVRKVKI
ncbi:MAG: GDP-L-fucose synthase [Spirochaetota bacterium]|nr:GDP-L-fucose synthase [Spirochaetota bacterium]